ncbi:phosphoglycerate mutase-like protein [Westerdykella ornata]|uniref:Phosphoglycerate mutase-like protein n=1 Tax=Westerdykella ornata TaxID=318751 RepID=A0A6A6J7Z0_WESOR|nr:phosphoglycerate mutase-like protein [Westerdykella ornata]KAF2271746.1 phosphoglycerate mutase-like protein [Westerdykella ornata]
MGKPRMIILVRHAQSEGNKNRDIHQYIPDHRVGLTQHGWTQAEEAGRTLRSMLMADDTIQFFTSPYRRTRETTEGILRTLTADDPAPSPFPRHKIKVYEEPRLREQDFGNFQPCSAEMERMWLERADYGHFFYRIPNGESAADAYDRVSGFNESLWRSFGEDDFPSVCVLVTHGLMTRIFLMKWYHWSVEYFEDLRNVNHCEFIVMKLNENGKYVLQNELRTWSELKRRAEAAKAAENGTAVESSPSKGLPVLGSLTSSPTIPARRWGGCVNGCNHDKFYYPRKIIRKNTADFLGTALPPPATSVGALKGEKEDHPMASEEADHTPALAEPSPSKVARKSTMPSKAAAISNQRSDVPASPNDASYNSCTSDEGGAASDLDEDVPSTNQHAKAAYLQPPNPLHLSTQGEGFSDDSDYFPGMRARAQAQINETYTAVYQSSLSITKRSNSRSKNGVTSKSRQRSRDSKLVRKRTEQSWLEESGVGKGTRADALGDGDAHSDSAAATHIQPTASTLTADDAFDARRILPEAHKGDMIVENAEVDSESHVSDCCRAAIDETGSTMTGEDVNKMKEASRKSMSEIY